MFWTIDRRMLSESPTNEAFFSFRRSLLTFHFVVYGEKKELVCYLHRQHPSQFQISILEEEWNLEALLDLSQVQWARTNSVLSAIVFSCKIPTWSVTSTPTLERNRSLARYVATVHRVLLPSSCITPAFIAYRSKKRQCDFYNCFKDEGLIVEFQIFLCLDYEGSVHQDPLCDLVSSIVIYLLGHWWSRKLRAVDNI